MGGESKQAAPTGRPPDKGTAMTTIDVDTSPLQAAREWRGIGLVAVAMNSGLPLAQAEALEGGDPDAFGSIDEMIAAAVVYGASLGIGRDEAMALLDRTVTRGSAPVVHLPERPNDAFSGAVHERSARISRREERATTPPLLTPALLELPDEPIAVPTAADEPVRASAPVLDVDGPSPEQAVAASGELHLDALGVSAPWERESHTGELEAWVDELDDFDRPDPRRERPTGDTVLARAGTGAHAALERVVGSDRADAIADRTRELSKRASEFATQGRERLRRSEHATLFVAIGAGAILIALVVALGGALGGDEPASEPAASEAPAAAEPAAPATGGDTAAAPADGAAAAGAGADAAPAAAKPIVTPAKLTVDVFNAGSQKGKAKTVAERLKSAGYGIGEVTNAKSDYAGPTVIHPKDLAREARTIARRAGITTLQVAPGSTRRITVIVA